MIFTWVSTCRLLFAFSAARRNLFGRTCVGAHFPSGDRGTAATSPHLVIGEKSVPKGTATTGRLRLQPPQKLLSLDDTHTMNTCSTCLPITPWKKTNSFSGELNIIAVHSILCTHNCALLRPQAQNKI